MVNLEKRKSFIINFSYCFIIGALVFWGLKFGLPFIAPFVVAFVIAFVLRRPILWIHRRCGLKRSFAAVLLVILFYGTIGVLLSLIGIRLFAAIRDWIFQLPNIYTLEIQPMLIQLFDSLEASVSKMDHSLLPALEEFSDNILQSISSMISGFSVWMLGWVSNYASELPGLFIRILFMIVATFFLAVDYDKIVGFLLRQLPRKQQRLVIEIKAYVVNTLLKCILSYLMIMSITFMELSIGLSLLGIKRAIVIALFISIFDILPVLGTGGIMIPWMVITVLHKNYPLALGLLVVYLIVTVVRNILEPKMVGNQVGLHPLITLIALFIGAQLFGVLGLFGLPITLSLLKNLNDKGTIHILK